MKIEPRLLILLLFSFQFGCSAPALKFNKAEQVCNNGKGVQKSSFLLSSYRKVPSGAPIERIAKYMETLERRFNFIADNFIKILFSRTYSIVSSDSVSPMDNNALLKITAAEKKGRFQLREEQFENQTPPRINIAWVAEDNFVVWDVGVWGGASGPGEGEFEYRSDGICDGFLAFFDPPDNDFGCGRSKISGPPWYHEPRHGLLRFVRERGFQAGEFLATHYFSVPERERKGLCLSAGLADDCFQVSSVEKRSEFYKALTDNRDLQVKFPFSYYEECNGDWSSEGCRLQRESSLAKDLILLASSKLSKKTEGDWVRYLITWDPSLMCKYARTSSDLYTH